MLVLKVGKRNVVMAALTFVMLLLTYADDVKATIISGFTEDTVYYHGTNHVLITAALVILMALCLSQNWIIRVVRLFGYLGNAIFWIIYIRVVIPMLIPMAGIYQTVYTYTAWGYGSMILSLFLVGCAAASLRE